MKKIKIKSFCKINLSLRVIRKLNNGYHSISSLVTFCNLYDVILLSKIKGSKDKISFFGRFKKNINLKHNTITKVLHLLRKRNFLKNQFFKISITKNIPHGSGLGGGSSNAANLLKSLNLKMSLRLNKKYIKDISNQIGFDVPINLEKKNTLLTGKADEIIRLQQKFKLNILIVYPNIICSTKKIYERNKIFSPSKNIKKFNIQKKPEIIDFFKKEKNDLEKTVIKLYPKINKIINFIKSQNGCYFSRITGSGSACIGIFSNMETANYSKKLIKRKFPKYWCVTSKTI